MRALRPSTQNRVDYMHANIIDSLTAICRGITVSIQLKRVSKTLTSVLAEPLTSIRFIWNLFTREKTSENAGSNWHPPKVTSLCLLNYQAHETNSYSIQSKAVLTFLFLPYLSKQTHTKPAHTLNDLRVMTTPRSYDNIFHLYVVSYSPVATICCHCRRNEYQLKYKIL